MNTELKEKVITEITDLMGKGVVNGDVAVFNNTKCTKTEVVVKGVKRMIYFVTPSTLDTLKGVYLSHYVGTGRVYDIDDKDWNTKVLPCFVNHSNPIIRGLGFVNYSMTTKTDRFGNESVVYTQTEDSYTYLLKLDCINYAKNGVSDVITNGIITAIERITTNTPVEGIADNDIIVETVDFNKTLNNY